MSSLLPTYSRFLYGFVVTVENNKIDFNEGAFDLVATIRPGNYSLGTYVDRVAQALNLSGVNTYAVSVDRDTRIITITVTGGSTDFLFATGTNVSQSASSMLGFNPTDIIGAGVAVGDDPVGSVYEPQFWLQGYVPPENSVMAAFATKNKSGSGRIQVQRFGTETFMKCMIVYATNIAQTAPNSPILDNPTGLEDLRSFLAAMTNQQPVEFYPDEADSDTYYTLILESTEASKDGTGFEIKEMQNFTLSGYFETGKLVFRVTEE